MALEIGSPSTQSSGCPWPRTAHVISFLPRFSGVPTDCLISICKRNGFAGCECDSSAAGLRFSLLNFEAERSRLVFEFAGWELRGAAELGFIVHTGGDGAVRSGDAATSAGANGVQPERCLQCGMEHIFSAARFGCQGKSDSACGFGQPAL